MASKFRSRLGDDLERLIRSIGDCKSKSEEDRILLRSIEGTKALLKSGKMDKSQTRDLMIKLLYFEMLGHDASFGHFMAVQGCGSGSLQTKLVAYLSVSQFLDSSDQLILLLVNTWRSDLQNDNFLVVCSALTTICKLVNLDAMGALVPQITSLITHSKEIVRKKVVMVLQKLFQLDPRFEGPLAGVDIDRLFRQALCDKDPSVMAATTCALYDMVKMNAAPFRNLIPSLVSILKQICEHRLSKSYEYHHVPAPFIQIKILKMLGYLGAGDRPATENMRTILLTVIKQASTRNNIGHAVLYECVRTITSISPDAQLLEAAAKSITGFLKPSNGHNLKYMGIDALAGIVRINHQKAQDYQSAVMDCLEDRDDTLKLKTLELLIRMTKPNNVEVVVGKLIEFLETSSDEHIQKDICLRVSELAERYAPDTRWYIETMTEMFKVAGEAVDTKIAHNLMRLIAEQEDDVHRSAVEVFVGVLQHPNLPEVLLQVVCWVLGEYGCLVKSGEEVLDCVCGLIHSKNCTETVKGYILAAVAKSCAQSGCSLTIDAEEIVRKAASSTSTELQQRALEIQALLSSRSLMAVTLPKDASCEDLEGDIPSIQSVSFLQNYVDAALQNGAAPYIAEEERGGMDDFTSVSDVGALKYEAYQKQEAPEVRSGIASLPIANVGTLGAQVAPSMAVSNEPQLSLHASGPRRWGPANFAPVDNQVRQPEPVFQEHVANAAQVLDFEHPNSGYEDDVSERDRLKASLFGSSKPSRFSRSKPEKGPPQISRPNATISAPATPSPDVGVVDLLDLGISDPVPSSSSADPFSGVDLLGGVEPQQTVSAEASRPALDLDALYGNAPTVSASYAAVPGMQHPGAVPMQQPQFPMGQTSVMGGGMGTLGGGPMVGTMGGYGQSTFGMGPGIGTGVQNTVAASGSSIGEAIGGNEPVRLGKQVKKDDPFKDLLG